MSRTSDCAESMEGRWAVAGQKTKSFYAAGNPVMLPVMPGLTVPLEDELGDVLEKAIRGAGRCLDEVARRAAVPAARVRDAVDYRSELTDGELQRLAAVLELNEVGLCALARGCYPVPVLAELPFRLQAVRMRHGVGVVNAYVVAREGASAGLLFDTGPQLGALLEAWPAEIERVGAVFLTHVEGEHAGGLCDVVDYFGVPAAFVPSGCRAPCGQAMGEGAAYEWEGLRVRAFSTPGHAAAHNCYLVSDADGGGECGGAELLVAGDLVFAGSAGGGYFCCEQHQRHLRRVLQTCRPETVIAPGHGPLTNVAHERRYNPFCA